MHLAPAWFLILAPVATAMLASDLRSRVAESPDGSYARDERPVLYWIVTATNAFVAALCWYQVAGVASAWLGR